MKKTIIGLLFTFAACQWLNPYPTTPEEVALKFRKAVLKGNFNQARRYCDESSANFLSIAEGLYEMSQSEEKAKNSALAADLVVVECRLNAEQNRARCTVCCDENNDVFTEVTDLSFVDNRWSVLISKFSQGGEDEF